jgi:hypothetical protein
MAQVAPAPGVVSDIRQAPQPPQVRAAPATADQISPGYVLPEPKPLPPKQILPQHPDVADALLKMRKYPGNQYVADQAAQVIKLREDQRAQQQAAIDEDYKNAQIQQREMTKLYQEQKATATQRGLTEAKTRQDLLGEGFTPMTQDQIKSLYPMGGQPAEGQSFWMNRRGEVKTGPAPPTSIDLRQESGEASTRGKLSAEAERKLIDAADKAGSDLYTIRRAQALQDQIKTGALEPSRMTIGAYAKSAGLSPETLKSLNLDPNGVGSQQAFDAINKELTLTKIGAGGMPVNNFSEADRNFVSSIVSGLGDDPVSNRIKLEVLAAAKTRDLEKAQAWAAFRRDPANATKRGEPPSFTDFEFNWNDQIKNKDVLGHLRAEAEAQIAKAKEQSGQQTPPTVSDGATATGPNGARLIRRGGKWEPM